jgi:hypothetical protein
MRTAQRTTVTGVAAVMILSLAMSDAAAAPTNVLTLNLNDSRSSSVAVDSSGRANHGRIGSHVVMSGAFADWDRHSPGEGVDHGSEHLITIPDAADGSLDPGSGRFSVEFRFRTKENFGNVLQKGQSSTPGGQVKFQIPRGKLSCMFKTPQGTATAGSGAKLLNDNVWHIVRCVRTPTSVTMFVDGVRTARRNHTTRTLNNSKPWTIGGKSECDALKVTCDYFAGEIDYVRMTTG